MTTALVFLDHTMSKAVPFTTSEVIAEFAGVRRRTIDRLLLARKSDFEEFGIMRFEISKIEGRGRPETLYQLNEQQATLLMTYLRNTPKVVVFKKELVRQFYAMRRELSRQKDLRAEGKPIRRSLTDAVRDSGEQERMHGHAYEAYTNLALKLATGRSAAQLRRERGASKGTIAADLLTSDELKACQRQEAAIAALLDIGLRYDVIRETLGGTRDADKKGACAT